MAEMWTLKFLPRKVKTIKPVSQPRCIFWPSHLLLSYTWALWRESPNADSLEVYWNPSGLQEPVPRDGGCGWSWFQEGTAPSPWSQPRVVHTLYMHFLPSASEWLCPNCLLPIAGCMNLWAMLGVKSESTSQKTLQGWWQPCGSLWASPVHEAMILFMGTHGVWILHGSWFNCTFNPLLDRAAMVMVWHFQWLDAFNFFTFTIADPCKCQAGI